MTTTMPQKTGFALPLWSTLAVGFIAILLDQASKLWILSSPATLGRMRITPFMDFVLVWNRGISYGLFNTDGAMGKWLITAFSLLICAVLVFLLRRTQTRLYGYGLVLILGGAAGNIIDRLAYNAVVDFISLHIGGYYWFVFNVADIWISIGVVMVLIDSFRRKPETG